MAARNYSSVARLASLTAGVNASTTTFAVDQTTGFPTIPFTAVVDAGRTAEEIVTVTSVVGLILTVIRGEDGTAGQPHDAAAEVRHMATARDYREPAEHIAQTSGVHGTTGLLVDANSTQSLDNKTFTPATTDHVPVKLLAASGQTANLLDVLSAGSVVLASVSVTGRLSTPGVDGTSSSTFTAGTAATVAAIVKGAASQSANLLSVRNDANTEVASIGPSGTVTAPIVSGGTINGSASVNTPTVNGTTQSIFTTPVLGTTPLIVKQPTGQTVPSLVVRDVADVNRAGVTGETGGFQLFHGSATNLVPFRIHAGSEQVTMLTGASSQGGSIDITSYGFNTSPLVMLTVRQENESSVKRRVFVNIEGAPTTTAIPFRVVQSADQNLPDDTTYRVHWMAIQMTPTTAAG